MWQPIGFEIPDRKTVSCKGIEYTRMGIRSDTNVAWQNDTVKYEHIHLHTFFNRLNVIDTPTLCIGVIHHIKIIYGLSASSNTYTIDAF